MPQIIETEQEFINTTMMYSDYLSWKINKQVDNILHIKHIYIVLYDYLSNIEDIIDDISYFRNLVTFSLTAHFYINTNILYELLKYKHITFTIKAPNLTNIDLPRDISKLCITLHNSYSVVYVSYSSPEHSYPSNYIENEQYRRYRRYERSENENERSESETESDETSIVRNLMDDFIST